MSELHEKYSRITDKIDSLWGTRACRDYIMSLITDTRGGTRRGFEPQIAKEIVALLHKHDKEFPQYDDSDMAITPMKFDANPRPRVRATHKKEKEKEPSFDLFVLVKWFAIGAGVLAGLKFAKPLVMAVISATTGLA